MKRIKMRIFVVIGAMLCLSSCEKTAIEGFDGASQEDLSDAEAYNASSPWAGNIKSCILAKTVDEACSLTALPLLGMEYSEPTINQILDRAVVSHAWMGERLEELLTTLPDEILLLTRSVTAIVIDDDIRPAYYDVNTGAIYIDPNYLWLDETEASTVNPQEDYRSEFSRPLNFRRFFRYVKDHQSAYIYRSSDNAVTRSLADIEYLFASLFLHELAHANDYFPPTLHNQLPTNEKPWLAALSIRDNWVSTRLTESQPLTSGTMFGLAGVMFLGDTATDEERDITPAQAGSVFDPDSASDAYSYSSDREDVAMLFEEVMMYHLFEIERDLTYVTAPEEGENACEDYIVEWGRRMRVATNQVSTRAQFVIEEIIPELDSQTVFANLPDTRDMPDGYNWCTSISFEQEPTSTNTQQKSGREELVEPMPYYH